MYIPLRFLAFHIPLIFTIQQLIVIEICTLIQPIKLQIFWVLKINSKKRINWEYINTKQTKSSEQLIKNNITRNLLKMFFSISIFRIECKEIRYIKSLRSCNSVEHVFTNSVKGNINFVKGFSLHHNFNNMLSSSFFLSPLKHAAVYILLSIYLSVYLSIYLSVYTLYIHLYIYIYIYIYICTYDNMHI